MNSWLLGGLGAGFVMGWMARQLTLKKSPTPPFSRSDRATQQALQEQIQQTQLAYGMAREMSQFKGGFLGRTSHELRSPLSAVISMHQLILADLCESPEEERDFIAQANAAALKMVKVLDEMIDVARVEHGSSQITLIPIQLSQLLHDVYTLTHLQAQNRNYRLHIPIPASDLHVLADARRLRQVLVNLLNTSILGMSSGAIALTVQPSDSSNTIHLWLDAPTPPGYWNDPLTLQQPPLEQLSAAISGSTSNPTSNPTSHPIVAYETVQQLAQTAFPSAGFTLLLAHLLLTSMQGSLTLVPIPTMDGDPKSTRIQITLPIAPTEAKP